MMTVDVPKGCKIHTQKENKYVYYVIERRYQKDKKYNNDKRISIGKLDEFGKLIPNKNYYELFPLDKELEPLPDRADSIKIGAHILINKILEDNGLSNILDEVYEEKSDLIKDVMSYILINESSTMQHFEDYTFEYALFSNKPFSDSLISKVFKELSISKHDLFLEKWNKIHNDTSNIYIAYDSTNMNSAACGANLLEYGHSKDDSSDLPQVNVSIGMDQNTLTPLFYEQYYGSIIDNTQCKLMVDKVSKYGYKNIGFIIDRGYFSLDNLSYFEKNDYNYIIMAKGNSEFIKGAIDEVRYKVKKSSNYIDEHEVMGITIKRPFNSKDIKDRYIHVYYDEVRAASERKNLMKLFSAYDKELNKYQETKLTKKSSLLKYEKYYTITYLHDYLTSFKRKENTIEELLDNCGYFAIITSEKMSSSEALSKYRNRDSVEKLFMVDKTFLESDVLRVYSNESIETKTAINFIALIIRNEIYKAIKKIKTESKRNYTVPSIINELNKSVVTKDSKNKYNLRYALTKTQKEVLKEFSINEKEYLKRSLNLI